MAHITPSATGAPAYVLVADPDGTLSAIGCMLGVQGSHEEVVQAVAELKRERNVLRIQVRRVSRPRGLWLLAWLSFACSVLALAAMLADVNHYGAMAVAGAASLFAAVVLVGLRGRP